MALTSERACGARKRGVTGNYWEIGSRLGRARWAMPWKKRLLRFLYLTGLFLALLLNMKTPFNTQGFYKTSDSTYRLA